MEPGILIRPSTIGMIAFPENESTTTSGNITTPVVPQGTSLDKANDSSAENIPQTGADNIQEPIVPG
jgi:hypothetical protein